MVEEAALPRLVLAAADVPSLSVFDEGEQSRGDLPAGERSDPRRFGRQGGWKARFRLEGATAESSGPLVVESRADLFEDADGAAQELDAARADVPDGWETVDVPELGEERWAVSVVQGGLAQGVRHVSIAWRTRNVVASLLVQGFEGRIEVDDVVELARKQERRIEAAANR